MSHTNRSYLYTATLLVGLVFISSLTAGSQIPASAPIREQPNEADLIHFGDLVDVDVIGSLEYDWRGTLTPEGFLDGLERSEEQIYALCRTEQDVAADITKEYGKTLRDPQVVVRIVDRSNRAAAILSGAVKNPQRFQLRRTVRLNELLALSGGITETASGTIAIFRPRDLNCTTRSPQENKDGNKSELGLSSTISISIKELLESKPNSNPEILSGDIITVTEAQPIYIIGAVNNPRQVASRPGMKLLQAVAEAGGEMRSAREVTIYRRGNSGTTIIETNLKKIGDGEMDDIELKPFDVVDVAQRNGSKRRFAPRSGDSILHSTGLFRLPVRIID